MKTDRPRRTTSRTFVLRSRAHSLLGERLSPENLLTLHRHTVERGMMTMGKGNLSRAATYMSQAAYMMQFASANARFGEKIAETLPQALGDALLHGNAVGAYWLLEHTRPYPLQRSLVEADTIFAVAKALLDAKQEGLAVHVMDNEPSINKLVLKDETMNRLQLTSWLMGLAAHKPGK